VVYGVLTQSQPKDHQYDSVKINDAVSWLKGTAQRWYKSTLDLDTRLVERIRISVSPTQECCLSRY
jgi:hypothetical protein